MCEREVVSYEMEKTGRGGRGRAVHGRGADRLHALRRGPEPSPGASQAAVKPQIPFKLELENGVPQLDVYDVSKKDVRTMDIESYVQGVLAARCAPMADGGAEGAGDPGQDLRTQVRRGEASKYKGADISTDITEAQAYDEAHQRPHHQGGGRDPRPGAQLQRRVPLRLVPRPRGRQTDLATKALDYEGTSRATPSRCSRPIRPRAGRREELEPTFTSKRWARPRKGGRQDRHGAHDRDGEKSEAGRAVTLRSTETTSPARRFESRWIPPSSSPR